MRAGTIKIDSKILLSWLQFPDAQILEANYDEANKILSITMADEEMPEFEGFSEPKIVMPTFVTYQDPSGNRVSIRQPIEKCNIK